MVLPNRAEFLPLLTAALGVLVVGLLVPDLMVEPNKDDVGAGFFAGAAGTEVEVKLSQTSSTILAFDVV